MKTTLILHVILMTVAMNNNMGFPNGTPLDHDAEDKFFAEFNGVCEDERNVPQILQELSFDPEDLLLLKQNILSGQFARERTSLIPNPVMCRPVLDKLATDYNSARKRVDKLCVLTIMYGEQTIGYRRTPNHSNLVYALVYNSEWRHINPFLHVYPPLMVLDFVDITLPAVAPAAK